jgi:hypothetical protein
MASGSNYADANELKWRFDHLIGRMSRQKPDDWPFACGNRDAIAAPIEVAIAGAFAVAIASSFAPQVA